MKNLFLIVLFFSSYADAYVDLSASEIQMVISLCGRQIDPASHELLGQTAYEGKVSWSQDYRPAPWESTNKIWDHDRYPYFIRVPYHFLCVFNLSHREAKVFIHD